jgi:hypothetical protein
VVQKRDAPLNYVAPVSGTAYVVEENSRKLIITVKYDMLISKNTRI